MAIQIQQHSGGASIMRMIVALVVLVVLGAGTYYLFFAPAPGFDYIVPKSLQETTSLSKFALDPNDVLDSPEFKSLAPIQGLPSGGSIGRANPFLPL